MVRILEQNATSGSCLAWLCYSTVFFLSLSDLSIDFYSILRWPTYYHYL